MLQYSVEKRTFVFKTPGGTSRGVLTEKQAWFIRLWDENNPEAIGLGECSIIPGLSPDFKDEAGYEADIHSACGELLSFHDYSTLEEQDLLNFWFFDKLRSKPSILFGLECAILDLLQGGKAFFYNTAFTRGEKAIPINGLIWMGSESFMQEQIQQKIAEGFNCIKLKIGAIDFETEFALLAQIRERFSAAELILRVDANGAFGYEEGLQNMQRLAELDIHSIEQPIRAGNWVKMASLCRETPLPIALDEELIGVYQPEEKKRLLDMVRPQFIILKPSLHGGICGTSEWIKLAEEREIPWWMTSALESNVGLNAIAQFTSTFDNPLHQGLGTGSLYIENTPTDLVVEKGFLKKIPV
ncbi:MAG: o-succinylbenzoate synthase [Crocinitomicaceae bacterium]|jgi:o-succinylbenzoate synthase|nr:o-succinylbenzoate synthase [Crocinitomicaceae bacterium]